jgi:hypothetical protein
MGYMKHEAVIVTTWFGRDEPMPDMDAFRASIPEPFRPLVVGPVLSVTNGYYTYALLPDGSKEGWDDSDIGDAVREAFLDLFPERYSDGSSRHCWVHVAFGRDHRCEVGDTVEGVDAVVVRNDESPPPVRVVSTVMREIESVAAGEVAE